MFTGFPSTQTPAVQWWDFSKTVAGTSNIALANDCAPVQYFATGGAPIFIQVTLPLNPAQGKTITFKNDSYNAANVQLVRLNNPLGELLTVVGQGASVTCCYIYQNTLAGLNGLTSVWAIISNGTGKAPINSHSVVVGGTASSASGSYSAILGGDTCNASGDNATNVGGSSNTASGGNSHTLGGSSNSSTGIRSVIVGGASNSNSGTNAVLLGGITQTLSGATSGILGGSNNTADAGSSAILGGDYGATRSIVGSVVSAASKSPIATTLGVSQFRNLTLGRQTTDATATVLCSDSSSASTTNQVILPNNSAYYFRGECVAGVTGAGNTKGWYIEGVIKRGANAASTSLVGSPTVTSSYADAGAATWNLTATADITNGGLAITATGQAATTIRWVVQMRTTEMTY